MFVRKMTLIAVSLVTSMFVSKSHALDFTLLECGAIQSTQSEFYDVRVPCKAIIQRGGGGRWYDAPGQECVSFCQSINGLNTASPDGFACTSGEARPESAIGVVNYAPTGCWHDCGYAEGRPGAASVGARCYAPGQKRDNDRTDTTVGCYCLTGDVHSNLFDIGVHTSGTAESRGENHLLVSWTNVCVAAMNDLPGRVVYIRGSIPLVEEAAVHFVLDVKGRCGTRVLMSGRANGSSGSTATSSEISIPLPACGKVCGDGTDNDQDGTVDSKDFSCVASKGESEHWPQAACGNGRDDDRDGFIDHNDSGCTDSQDNSEEGCSTACEPSADHSGDLVKLEGIIRAQRILVYELVDPIIKTVTDPAIKAQAQEFRDLADTIKRELVRDMNRNYPKTTQLCSNCPVQDLTAVTQDLVARSRKMHRLTRQVVVFARGVNCNVTVRQTLQTAYSLFDQFRCAVGSLPNRTSVCPR